MLSLAEIATHIPASIPVFEKYQIDFFRKGKRTLEEACNELSLQYFLVEQEITQSQSEAVPGELSIHEWDVDRLIDLIRFRYHSAEKFALALISTHITLAQKETHRPVLDKLNELFHALVAELQEHSDEEERELFPYLKKLSEMKKSRTKPAGLQFLLHHPIRTLEAEHEHTGALLDEICALTNNYAPIPNAPLYNELMHELRVFQQDFHTHIHLENNVLFPKALELESELREMMR